MPCCKTNISNKASGDKFFASEFNELNQAVNNNADEVESRLGALESVSPAYVKLRSAASQDANGIADLAIEWDVQEIEPVNITHSTGGQNSTITIQSDGVYSFSGAINYYGTTGNYRLTTRVSFMVNGVTLPSYFDGSYIRASSGSFNSAVNFSILLDLNAGDTVQILSKRLSTVTGNGVTTDGTTLSVFKLPW